ncbi:MAG: hypothetical protein EKK47_23215 [Burkholderiales bacterium]|nr:MAG: hypothetical protein EKK47_23215 [Burkholderiales bacterium]
MNQSKFAESRFFKVVLNSVLILSALGIAYFWLMTKLGGAAASGSNNAGGLYNDDLLSWCIGIFVAASIVAGWRLMTSK